MGRPRRFCSQSCRQWHWVGRQRARELQLSDGELLVVKSELDSLHDQVYVLACAVNDTERDLEAAKMRAIKMRASTTRATVRELQEMLDWILEAARPLRDRELNQRP